ncbi:hypothetical protein BBJ28_00023352 [Nothophytophthora sp. Chile5]|nr:hypothetical protein BBJ28_00023352 [Nothophytophthora sp. Chile5]
MSQATDAQRDAIVTWLERVDNFVRVTTPSRCASSSSSRRGGASPVSDASADRRKATAAFNELATFVNAAAPASAWNGEVAYQRLADYLLQYRAAVTRATSPQFALTPTDKQTGLRSVADKLETLCRHFGRLQSLHAAAVAQGITGEATAVETAVVEPRKPVPRAPGPSTAATLWMDGDEKLEKELDTGVNSSNMRQKQKALAGGLVVLESDEDEVDDEFPVTPRVDTSKKPPSGSATKKTTRSSDGEVMWLQRKARRVERSAGAVESSVQGTRSSASGHSQDELRSAIAQVISQRQQLVDSRAAAALSRQALGREQQRVEEEEQALASDEELSAGFREHEVVDGSRSSRDMGDGASGFLPVLNPLLSGGDTQGMERKRMFLRAKQLAFQQVKWQQEKELQERELELLRSEMQARETLAQRELQLRRLRVRAELMHPMIVAGASAAQIAERLQLL